MDRRSSEVEAAASVHIIVLEIEAAGRKSKGYRRVEHMFAVEDMATDSASSHTIQNSQHNRTAVVPLLLCFLPSCQ